MTLQTILKSSLLLAFIFSNCNGKTAEEWKGRIIYQVISLINLFIPQETVPQHHPVTVFTVLYIICEINTMQSQIPEKFVVTTL